MPFSNTISAIEIWLINETRPSGFLSRFLSRLGDDQTPVTTERIFMFTGEPCLFPSDGTSPKYQLHVYRREDVEKAKSFATYLESELQGNVRIVLMS